MPLQEQNTDTVKWKKTHLTWNFHLADANTLKLATYAFSIWAANTSLTFERKTLNPDILISYRGGIHTYIDNKRKETIYSGLFDGPGGVLAHAFPPMNDPMQSTEIHVDVAEPWHIQLNESMSENKLHLLYTLTHEIGHSLGLSHNYRADSLMFPYVTDRSVWKWPQGPNHRIHLDFCGPIRGHMYSVITDAYSKWIDVKGRAVKEYTSTWGVPYQIVSDNGPAFASEQFKEFVSRNAIKHTKMVPYHPASNGAAENAVRTFKKKFKLLLKDYTRQDALCKYLFHYRVTPHCTTEKSPAELQLNRRLRTRLDIIKGILKRRPNLIKVGITDL
ncbi:Uncharacterized protein K02A2.6 [Cyphomyrmex costatus]|uniref:Uncharacterized protein K02A2.6 n=1 Tax=Cyphomyrmex costatus TaxID=456900 RepID=A0A151IA17_9HYME|nr:Uncharacterized protein K02A2.6 [Cyphomyrmex costatus]